MSLQEFRRPKNPISARVPHFKYDPARPPASQFRQFLLNFRVTLCRTAFDQSLKALQIHPGGVVHGDFNAAAKPNVADPDESTKRSGENKEVQDRKFGADGDVHESGGTPME